MPGDWHLLKNAAETLRDMLWDGRLRTVSNACGHLKEINQWKDIHNILTGLHESLLNESMVTHANTGSESDYLSWFHQQLECEDEIGKFWNLVLRYLHAYTGFYVSIRSGNFNFRNACLPILTELFLHTLMISMKNLLVRQPMI